MRTCLLAASLDYRSSIERAENGVFVGVCIGLEHVRNGCANQAGQSGHHHIAAEGKPSFFILPCV